LSRLYLGYNAATRRALNDYGAASWYSLLANYLTAAALRARDALLGLQAVKEPPEVTGAWPAPRRRDASNTAAAGGGGGSGGDGSGGSSSTAVMDDAGPAPEMKSDQGD
jgi:hypothetical protein